MKAEDHRTIGRRLGIFHISSEVGIGLPLWLANGVVLRKILTDYLEKKQQSAGYLPVITPHIGKLDLYKTSGHWETFRQNMYQPIEIDKEKFVLKPMNCPHHIEIYRASPRSYKELPLRLAEFGTVYRYEKTGELLGLTRTRGFTIDDAHIFCAPGQLQSEFKQVLDLVVSTFKKFDFQDFKVRIGLKDSSGKYVGSDEAWDKAEQAIERVVKEAKLEYTKEKGEAAFYGPKLDFLVKDSLGRQWQLGTIQVDYNLPERFKLEYTDKQGQKQRPVMIHRAPFGSLERFVAILLEHFKGQLPVWLAPVQLIIIPVSEKFAEAAEELAQKLASQGARVKVDETKETVAKRVALAKKQGIPEIMVYGAKEVQDKNLTSQKIVERIKAR